MSKQSSLRKSEKQAKTANDGYIRGACLSDDQEIKHLEERVRADHYDVEARCTLLGVYVQPEREKDSERWCKHFEWLIKNCPHERFMSDHVWRLPRTISDEQYGMLETAFLRKAERNQKNADVLGNAAIFLDQRNPPAAIKLFKQARKLAPQQEIWSYMLLMSYRRLARSDKKFAEKTFRLGEKLVKVRERKDGKTFFQTQWLCTLALEVNDLKRAKKYVNALKGSEHQDKVEWQRHQLVGLLAMKEGKINRAKKHLIKAAHEGDRLENLQLADSLVKEGDLHTAKVYLELCLTHAHNKKRRKVVKEWISQLNKGVAIELR